MARARKALLATFPDATFSSVLTSPDYNAVSGPYANCIARGTTSLSESDLVTTLKSLERQLGRTHSKDVMIDLDLLQYNDERHHLDDWSRPYIKILLTILLLFVVNVSVSVGRTLQTPQELLTKATEYYQGGKYHESILCFEKLQEKYTLTPRYLAYLGFSYYKEVQYDKAAQTLLPLLRDTTRNTTLSALSPKEQAVYLYACGESLFHIGDFLRSLEIYERMLPLVNGLDKADVLFHIGMAHYMQSSYQLAISPLEEALAIYTSDCTPYDALHNARKSQIAKMLPGLKHEVQSYLELLKMP